MTLFLYFQLECCAMGWYVTDNSFKRPEHHWSENTERKKNASVGSIPRYRGSSEEIGRQREVRSVWFCIFHFTNSSFTFCSVLFSENLQESCIMGKPTKQRHIWSCLCPSLSNKASGFLKFFKAASSTLNTSGPEKNVEMDNSFVSITQVGFRCWCLKQILFIKGWLVARQQKSVFWSLQVCIQKKTVHV